MMLKLYVDNQDTLLLVSKTCKDTARVIWELSFVGAAPVTTFGKGVGPVHFSYFYCSGSENYLLNCTYYTYSWCYYSYHAGVKCEGNSDTQLCGILNLI